MVRLENLKDGYIRAELPDGRSIKIGVMDCGRLHTGFYRTLFSFEADGVLVEHSSDMDAEIAEQQGGAQKRLEEDENALKDLLADLNNEILDFKQRRMAAKRLSQKN